MSDVGEEALEQGDYSPYGSSKREGAKLTVEQMMRCVFACLERLGTNLREAFR